MMKLMMWCSLVCVGGMFSYSIMAKNLVVNTPEKEARYEPSLQGWLNVNATVFNAPCNLQLADHLTLTNCGAGDIFDDENIRHLTAKTPVILQFFDVRKEHIISRYSLGLSNGNNVIGLPLSATKLSIVRLEVIYE